MRVMEADSPLNRTLLTAVSLLISFTLGGLSAQIGLLVSPIAAAFGLTQTVAAAQFSWLTGGILGWIMGDKEDREDAVDIIRIESAANKDQK